MHERARRQFGCVARRQLIELGFPDSGVDHWLATGRLHRRYPGVYALGREDLGTRGELAAALLYAGNGAALGGLTALWWCGLLGKRPHPIRVDAPGDRRSRPDVAIRHPRTVRRRLHRDLPVVPLEDALLAAASTLGPNTLRLVLARAEFRGLLALSSLQASVGPGRPGSHALRAAMDAHLPELGRCASRLERDFVLLCERFGLPLPEPNPRIGRYRPDMLWRPQMLIVELDGRAAHSSAAQRAADRRRQEVLEALGYMVLRFGWDDVQHHPGNVAAEVRAALDTRPPAKGSRGPGAG